MVRGRTGSVCCRVLGLPRQLKLPVRPRSGEGWTDAMNRRQFLAAAGAGTIAVNAAPFVRARAGRTFRTALLGSGWWGMNILREAIAAGQTNVVGLCDVDSRTLA